MARTTYSKSFSQNQQTVKPVKEKMQDTIKVGSVWLGETSYGKNFKQPNPEDFARKVKNVEKLEENPRFGRQYRNKWVKVETTYKNNFLGQGTTMCPAKVKLETQMKGGFSSVRDRFG